MGAAFVISGDHMMDGTVWGSKEGAGVRARARAIHQSRHRQGKREIAIPS
jgi:hypothetical protein